jgi:CheY-like chemotaxis protein
MLDEQSARALEGARPGAWMVLHVEDTGTGIPDEALAHIWDPFFTTKGPGKGTGLGLSTVRGIVENHKGFITLRTQSGRGTTFRVHFPAAEVAATEGKSAPLAVRGNGELILIVDDEALIREVTAAVLSLHGYRALVAKDGSEALAMFGAHRGEIRLIVTDFNMPNFDGAYLVNALHKLDRAVKILAMSGQRGVAAGAPAITAADAFLAKPFDAETLLQAVEKLLHTDSMKSWL